VDAAAVAAVLAACDRATVTGCRDYAVLIMLARLGLRAHEAAGLELDDIRWRSGTVVLRRKGGRSEELPLPADAGQALADYLLIRPVSSSRAVFISAVAPRRPLTRSAVTLLARRHCAAAGIGSGGAHRLRHTLASDLLAAGADSTSPRCCPTARSMIPLTRWAATSGGSATGSSSKDSSRSSGLAARIRRSPTATARLPRSGAPQRMDQAGDLPDAEADRAGVL